MQVALLHKYYKFCSGRDLTKPLRISAITLLFSEVSATRRVSRSRHPAERRPKPRDLDAIACADFLTSDLRCTARLSLTHAKLPRANQPCHHPPPHESPSDRQPIHATFGLRRMLCARTRRLLRDRRHRQGQARPRACALRARAARHVPVPRWLDEHSALQHHGALRPLRVRR